MAQQDVAGTYIYIYIYIYIYHIISYIYILYICVLYIHIYIYISHAAQYLCIYACLGKFNAVIHYGKRMTIPDEHIEAQEFTVFRR